MNRSTRTYNKNTNPFFSFTGKIFLKEKTCVAHYSYDVHGNVKTLIQDNAGISIAEQRYKKIEYEYDLISGKVNAVHYQNNQPDQFHHKYEYDADNRITDVYTSKDKILWDHDAEYFYYPHGPLARVEYGDNHVQGIDYAYTLQGWIKGINSETLSETNDIGQDGNPLTGNPNAHFAKDAFGYSLTYFEGDYKSIGTSSFLADKTNSDLLKARNDLFNGNISAMVTTIVPPTVNGNTISYSPLSQGTSYKYDQLNRLVEMQAWQNMDAANNIWNSGLAYAGVYHNKFTYDGNGNIETAFVKNNLGEIIDDQTYQYNLVNGKKTNNRLLAVADVATQTDGYDLPSTQQANNYIYTELGELKQDVQDSILDIIRRTDGKILQVIRTAGSTKKNLKFDYDATGNRIAKHVYNNDGTWIKSEFYVRDAQGNILSTYKHAVDASTQTAGYKQTERHLYGSSLLGIDQTQTELIGAPPVSLTTFSRTLGLKSYTGANHLGNDLVIFTDKKIGIDKDNDGIVDYYTAEVLSAKDYGPFGEYLTGRVFNASKYPNSFNGKRDDEELFGWQDYGFRNYMKAVRRFDRVDPLSRKFPMLSSYQFAGSNPILFIDLDGLEPASFGYAKTGIEVSHSTDIKNAIIETSILGVFVGTTLFAPVATTSIINWALLNPSTAEGTAVAIISAIAGYEGPDLPGPTDDFARLGRQGYQKLVEKGINSKEELGKITRNSYNAIIVTIDDEIEKLPTLKEKAMKAYDIRNKAKDFARELSGPELKKAAEKDSKARYAGKEYGDTFDEMFEANYNKFKNADSSDKDATNKAYEAIIESAKKPSKEKNKAYGAE